MNVTWMLPAPAVVRAINPRWPDGKPRIYRYNGTWFCRLREDLGHGNTPTAAFYDCLRESMQRYDFA